MCINLKPLSIHPENMEQPYFEGLRLFLNFQMGSWLDFIHSWMFTVYKKQHYTGN
jgi:hypothetical protein